MTLSHHLLKVIGAVAACFHLLGFLTAGRAIMTARTSQGAIAWALSLVSFPYVSLPLYWIFGRDRFFGYMLARHDRDVKVDFLRRQQSESTLTEVPALGAHEARVFEGLAQMRFRRGNEASLCIDGKATFDAIFRAIDEAKEYLLVQFFIVHDDELGRAFQAKLVAAARRGVKVYFLYDEIGSHSLPRRYRRELTAAGVDIRPFLTTKGAKNRFQLNFRNHRKIVVADGAVALVGGHNVGDEYLGKNVKLGHWRDTHVQVRGPAVAQVQISFIEDWHWSTGTIPLVKWQLEAAAEPGKSALVIPSGPADKLDTCCLFFLQAIHAAKRRLWIASPYFVPDFRIISALQLAAMRGVDVRILLPNKADHLFVYLASFSYLKDTVPWNIRMYRYTKGFLHQKVLLVDDAVAAVGTANLDNRSFRLNFELTLLFADEAFAAQVERMLTDDFANARPVAMTELTERPYHFKLAVQVARLMAPIL